MIKEEDPRFRHLDKKIGIFVAMAIAGFLAAFFFIGAEKDLFTKKYTLKFTVDKGTGFSRGMPVKLSGFRIGRIKSIALNQQAKVDIEIQIDREYQKWIKQDSVAKLVKEGMVGDYIIEVSVGSPQAEVLKDGSFMKYEKSRGLEEIANDIYSRITPILDEFGEMVSYVNNPQSDFKQSMQNIRELTAALNGTREKLDQLFVNTDHNVGKITTETVTLLKNTTDRVNSIAPAVEKLDRSMARIEQEIPPLLAKAQAAMDHVEKTGVNLEQASTEAVPRIPLLLNSAEDLLQDSDLVMKALGNTWPLRTNMPPLNVREFVPGDSHE